MKTKLYFFVLLFLASIFGYSQIVTTQQQAVAPTDPVIEANTLLPVFSNLEKDRIPNGLLLDAAIEFADLKKYDGTMPDSSFTSSKLVVDVYNTLIMSRLSSNAQITKSTETFTTEWKTAQQPDVIPLGGLYYKYAQFSELTQQNAVNTGNPGTLNITNGKVIDNYVNGVLFIMSSKFAAFFLTSFGFLFLQAQHNLTVNISNLTTNKGTVEIGVYNKQDGFLKEGKHILKKQIKVVGNKVSYTFKNLPNGYYAVALYQDENSNKKCDTNFIGIPKEPYGFSNNFKPKLSPPSFNDVKVLLNTNKSININLIQ